MNHMVKVNSMKQPQTRYKAATTVQELKDIAVPEIFRREGSRKVTYISPSNEKTTFKYSYDFSNSSNNEWDSDAVGLLQLLCRDPRLKIGEAICFANIGLIMGFSRAMVRSKALRSGFLLNDGPS